MSSCVEMEFEALFSFICHRDDNLPRRFYLHFSLREENIVNSCEQLPGGFKLRHDEK